MKAASDDGFDLEEKDGNVDQERLTAVAVAMGRFGGGTMMGLEVFVVNRDFVV